MPTAALLRPGGWNNAKEDNPTYNTLTRLHPLHPLTRSAPYALDPVSALLPSFGNQSNLHKSTSLSILSNPSETVQQHQDYVFNNYDAYRKICDWFDCWRDWQKKILLCGITNR